MYDDLERDEFENKQPKFIDELKMQSKELMMDMIYKALINNEMGALQSNSSVEDKIEAVNTVLIHYKNREEYEKCHELKKIIQKLQHVNY